MKVGQVAKRTGLSVRTLHYYDQIGLLSPSTFTPSGHRVYGDRELLRLQQIKSLRQLGFSLDEVRECLDAPAFSPKRVIALHVDRLRRQIAEQSRLVALLETLGATLDSRSGATIDEVIETLECMTSIERAFTPEELATLKARRERLGEAHIRAAEAEWPTLIARARAELRAGTDPRDRRMRPIAKRWRELVEEFTGGDPTIARKVRAAYVNEPKRMARNGLDPELFAYVRRAIDAL